MILVQNNTNSSVIDGNWNDQTIITSGSESSNFVYDDGIFSSVTSSATSRVWNFIPNLKFSNLPHFTTTEYDSGGIRIERVTSRSSSRLYKLDSSVSGGVIQYKFHGFNAGTYGRYVADIITPLMEAEGAEWGLFNESATQWNRNCWGFGFDLTGIVTRSSYWGGWTKERGGFAITPRHIVCANHYPIGVGQQVRFITKGETPELDTVVTKTLTHGLKFGDDNLIYLLDSDLPTEISPIQWSNYEGRAPAVMCGQYSDLVLKTGSQYQQLGDRANDWRFQQFSADGIVAKPYTRVGLHEFVNEWFPFYTNCAPFIRPLLSGDSGSPHLSILDENTMTFRTISTGGPLLDINAAIIAVDSAAGISTGYTVTVAPAPLI